ncbi:MAG: phosphate ABC transporter substrate-binding protein PstS [Chloroflexi bacterium]|nr:phosphate ABC transporter substrate-binding protein PstS [Chloroflexota bacterium]
MKGQRGKSGPTQSQSLMRVLIIGPLVVSLLLAACQGGGGQPTSTSSGGTIRLNGAGATFPFPLYSRWFDEYAKITDVQVNYQSIGSGGGIRQITEGTVDFGASDGIMTEEQIKAAEKARGSILHIPSIMGAVAVSYNLPGIPSGQLKLTPDILADIYLKKITSWNDPRIAQTNPGLPNIKVAVVHRSDGSGTTYIFTNYLSKVSPEWKEKVGNATAVSWPGDIGGQGNEGVAGLLRQTPGAIGYVELAYAKQNKMPWAALRNAAGNFIEPSLTATSLAAQGVPLPDDMKIMITNPTNPQAYPIVGFTWILAYQKQTHQTKGKALVDMLWWAIHDGQKYAPPLDYAPLPEDAVRKGEAQIRSITYNGQPLWQR